MSKKKAKIKLKKKEIKRLKRRANVLFVLFLVFYLIVISVVFKLQVTQTKSGIDIAAIATAQSQQLNVLEAERGTIYDSQGDPLAVNVKEYKMIAVLDENNEKYDTSTYEYKPYYIEDPVEDAKEIIKILGYEDDETASTLIKSQLLKDPEKYKQVEFGQYGDDISLEQKTQLEEAEINGLYFEEKIDRYYPYGDFASYIIGYAQQYVDDETGEVTITGELGVEKLLNSILSGVNGETEEVRDKQGVLLEEPQIVKQKSDGSNVYLTIDSTIQSYVHDFMTKYTEGQGFSNATTVVMDADTGAILAAEKLPSYDPNLKDIEDYQDPYLETCYEPGSIIKTFLIAEAMREGVWEPNKAYPSGVRTDPRWGYTSEGDENYVGDWLYNDTKESWGTISYAEGYYFSSNVAMTYILDDIGYEDWVNAMSETFEFGVPVQNQMYSSAACTYDPEYDFEIATTSFGQGMTANAMQIMRAYSTFSGDGRMVNPYVIDKIKDPQTGVVFYEGKKDPPANWIKGEGDVHYDEETGQYYKQVITEEQNQEILQLMKQATYYNEGGDFQGTGYSYSNTKYGVGTKTGTAEVAVNGNYNNTSRLFSVVIMAPVEDPEIILYTSVLNPEVEFPQGYMKLYTRDIVDNSLDYLLEETRSEVEFSNETDAVVSLENYQNQELSEVKTMLDEKNLNYKAIGSGKVAGQYPIGDSNIDENQNIYLIGSDVSLEYFTGTKKDDMTNYCLAGQVICEFEGSGKVSNISLEDDKYKITLK